MYIVYLFIFLLKIYAFSQFIDLKTGALGQMPRAKTNWHWGNTEKDYIGTCVIWW